MLDYLEEEQKRKITIKTANITLLYKTAGNPTSSTLLILRGTWISRAKSPEPYELSTAPLWLWMQLRKLWRKPKSSRGKRLRNGFSPVLFINKVDRLITELQLNEEQIQKKLDHIISSFNDLIELYCEEPFKNQWKITLQRATWLLGQRCMAGASL